MQFETIEENEDENEDGYKCIKYCNHLMSLFPTILKGIKYYK